MADEQDKSNDPDHLSRIVMLTYGAMENGGQYWCYVAVKPSRFEEFKRAMDSKQYNIQNFVDDGYGEVVVSGEGVMPPPDVNKQVAEMFGVSVTDLFKDMEPEKAISNKLQNLNEESS